MAWYNAGTVTVTNGSRTVTGAGTAFVANVVARDAFMLVGGQPCEIARVVSDTQLELERPWLGASAGGVAYVVQPTVGIYVDLALRALNMLGPFQAVLDGVGQGLIGDGTREAPAVRFLADQDTGLWRAGANILSLVAGGTSRLAVTPSGVSAVGNLDLSSGNLWVGVTGAVQHAIAKDAAEGSPILSIFSPTTGAASAFFYAVANSVVGGTTAALGVGSNGTTLRSINARGTVNANGADFAEYMAKSEGCGTIAAGEVCGVDRDGLLTKAWADAHSFVVKSQQPGFVAGDSWAAHLGPQPEEPVKPADASARAIVTWEREMTAYRAALAAWETAYEAARQKVDRIAFCGQVPVDVDGPFAPGDYLIADQDGDGIRAVAVPEAEIAFPQYRRRLGRVWAVRDGRAWINVQHG